MPTYTPVVNSKGKSIAITSNTVDIDGLNVRTIDRNVQEDARQLTFTEHSNSRFEITSETALNLAEQRKLGHSLFLNLRVDSSINDRVSPSLL